MLGVCLNEPGIVPRTRMHICNTFVVCFVFWSIVNVCMHTIFDTISILQFDFQGDCLENVRLSFLEMLEQGMLTSRENHNTHTYIHPYNAYHAYHAYLHTCIPAYIRAYVHTYPRSFIHSCIHANASIKLHACIRSSKDIYILTNLYTYTHTYNSNAILDHPWFLPGPWSLGSKACMQLGDLSGC